MESVTYFRNIKISPKKLRFFMPQLRSVSPGKALELLAYTQKQPARTFYKAIKSAMANAKATLKVNDDLLQFKSLSVDEGQSLKRYNPGSRGNAKPYKRRYSHIRIVLTVPTVKPSTLDVRPSKKTSAKVVEKSVEKPVRKSSTKKVTSAAKKK